MLRQGELRSIDISDPAEMAVLVSRITASRHFRRASRVRAFFEYVCEETLAGRADLINEQSVGQRVFGRVADYDAAADNIVRVEARELRKRLDAYYADEGAVDPFVIRMPKGGYAVIFEPREVVEVPPINSSLPAPATQVPSQRAVFPFALRPHHVVVLGLCLALGFLSLVTIGLYRKLNQQQPAPANRSHGLAGAFWARVFNSGRPTVICLPDSNFALLQDLRAESVALSEYASGRYFGKLKASGERSDTDRIFAWIASRDLTGVGSSVAMAKLLSLSQSYPQPVIRSARDITIRDLKGQNAILLGSARSNPWVELFQQKSRFTIDQDSKLNEPLLRDRRPEPGKPAFYNGAQRDGISRDAFGVITSTPNLDGSGHAIIVAGTGNQGTEAVGDFLANDVRFSEFLQQIGWHEDDPLPVFDLALRVVTAGSSSSSSQILAYRSSSP